MAQTPEGKVKAAVDKMLKAYGAYWLNPATGGYGASGVSDKVACMLGRFIAIECKVNGTKKPTPLQLLQLQLIRDAGGISLVIHKDNLLSLDRVLRDIRTDFKRTTR